MFSAPLAIVNYTVVQQRLRRVTVIVEFAPDRQSTAAFIRDFTERFARAGDERFGYRLVERDGNGVLRDHLTG